MNRAILLLICLLPAGRTGAQIPWESGFEPAMQKAREQKRIVVLVLNTQGDRASDRLMGQQYKDPVLLQLAARTVNVFCCNDRHKEAGPCPRCGVGTCADHRNNDFHARRKVFAVDGAKKVVVPQHVFLSPEGKVICACAGAVTAGELEWMWVHALRTLDPRFTWQPGGRYRAPARFRKGSGFDAEMPHLTPPSKAQVKAAIERIEADSGGRGGRGRFGAGNLDDASWDVIVRSDESDAVKFATRQLRDKQFDRWRILYKIGETAPESWSKVVTPYLSAKESGFVRRTAVSAIGKLGDAAALGRVRALYAKEDDEVRRGRILRTLATLAPTKAPVLAMVKKAVTGDASEVVRAHATVAAGILEDRAAVTACLRAALGDQSPSVRSTAAYVIAVRQDLEMAEALATAARAETELETREWLSRAQGVLRDGNPQAFASFLGDTLDARPATGNGPGGDPGAGPGRQGPGRGPGRRR